MRCGVFAIFAFLLPTVGCKGNATVQEALNGKEYSPPLFAPTPGRDPVKYATDPLAKSISQQAKATSIQAILALARPPDLGMDDLGAKNESKRFSPFETTVWRVKATLDSLVIREDGDLYLVLRDLEGRKMVAEISPAGKVASSPLQAQIRAAFDRVTKRFRPSAQPQSPNCTITVTGIGFYGKASNSGSAPSNGARLMPVLKVELP